ncbi:NADH-quinone oxidoreductase subunit L [Brasilonema bromeliae]|uniref:NADH-quinone oxidoreductase subunit L n=1 Tax=Brasilonema bromeliae SPC951 TaxID=385972 RepID=A0ABX1PCD7_9CYAN|nr:NADH-quinone oxidoreductase subunit L [Brasilonema bromeliae]NMG22138.1 NADH-quinone oxidoreductase subunit L [Brasilonema bromeliae SPC951]
MIETIPSLLLTAAAAPLFAALVACAVRLAGRGRSRAPALVSTIAVAVSLLSSLVALAAWASHHGVGSERAGDAPNVLRGTWLTFAQFGGLRFDVSYSIDALTIVFFCVIGIVATCVHVYAIAYMHEETHASVEDHEIVSPLGDHLHRPGRYAAFFQHLSLFTFSMFGLVLTGNLLVLFAFWELVGATSYSLIGFYRERDSAASAARQAFVVNRVGDAGFLLGILILANLCGTLELHDLDGRLGIVSQFRMAANHFAWAVPARVGDANYGLLVLAGLGVCCGCVGKSAQAPLHAWLPDAMAGPTPVSALVHSATMVAAGVYLVARLAPVFPAEVLLVLAYVGAITLTLGALFALTATDLKRVLAFSTISQLGYMTLAVGVGGWNAATFHLTTHAFFKSLLFLGAGAVIHATHVQDLRRLGGLLKPLKVVAVTMLLACVAMVGAGLPLIDVGTSGYYSKDAILAQALAFSQRNPQHAVLFYLPLGAALLTAAYIFRLWFLTFVGPPRDPVARQHVHEPSRLMTVPLVVLATLAISAGWTFGLDAGLSPLLGQAVLPTARPGAHARSEPESADSTAHVADVPSARTGREPLAEPDDIAQGRWLPSLVIPAEAASHTPALHLAASLGGFAAGLAGFAIAAAFYGWRWLSADELARSFAPLSRALRSEGRFTSLYRTAFVAPTLAVARAAKWFDRVVLDGIVDGSARLAVWLARVDDRFDRGIVDGFVNAISRVIYETALSLRVVQTGRLRQYVLILAVGAAGLFLVASWWLSPPAARP